MAAHHKIALNVVVNGAPVIVDVNENAPLRSLVEKALEESHNVGQPPDNWEIRDEKGNLLDLAKKIGTFGFAMGATLLLKPESRRGRLKDGVGQVVDPAVSRSKFDREIAQYRALEQTYVRRGWWLIRAEYPLAVVAFIALKTKPRSVAFGAILDFTNYDLWPPSVRLTKSRQEWLIGVETSWPHLTKLPHAVCHSAGAVED